MNMSININETSLKHHGVKGQKWGVRRFQNRDGSLTSVGKKRYVGKVGRAEGKSGSSKKASKKDATQKKDLTEEERAIKAAEEEAKKRRRVRIGMAAGATAVAAIGGAALYKYRKMVPSNAGGNEHKKALKDMTVDELIDENKRMAAEQKYKKLRKEQAGENGKFDGLKQGLAAASAATAMIKEATAAARKWKESNAKSENAQAEKSGDTNVSAMSDAQLRERVNRLNLENQYRNLMRQSVPQETSTATKSKVDSVLDGIGSVLTTASKIADKADVIAEAFNQSADG